MKAETYFEKNGFIYGVSEKYSYGKWRGYAIKFDNLDKANKWLNREERDFRIRSLVSKSYVLKNKYDVCELLGD